MKPALSRRKHKPAHSEDTDAFIKALRRNILEHCEGLSAHKFADALFLVTDELWQAGIDDAWVAAKLKDRRRGGNIFCITWLTMLATHLDKFQTSKKRS